MAILAALPVIGALVDPIGRIGELIAKAKLKRDNAETEQKRISADERIKSLELRRDELARDPWAPHIRLGFAAPFVIYNAKLVLWDKVLEWGVTDGLSTELAATQAMVIGFYFLHTIFKRR